MLQLIGLEIAAAASLATPAAASAPPTPPTAVAEGALEGTILRPYDNVWLYTVRFPDGRVRTQGLWSDHLERAEADGRPVLKRVQGMTYLNGVTSAVINVFDPATLRPYLNEQHRPDGSFLSRRFEGRHVVAEHRKAGESAAPVSADLTADVFDFYGGMFGLIIAAAPLKDDYAATLPIIAEDEDVAGTVSFKVVGREWVNAGFRGRVRAWVVTSETPGQYVMKFWLIQAPPYILKLEMTYPGQDYVASWDMIS
jgi:hypothetical protein